MRRLATLALPFLLAASLAGCVSGDAGGPAPGCAPVASGCTSSTGCCSFRCTGGTCVPNQEGGGCGTTPDCQAGLLCANHVCSSTATCRTTGDVCPSDLACCSGNCTATQGCQPNTAPVASAGPDQSPLYLRTVTLDGSGSHDADGDPLAWAWTFVSVPAGSLATLALATTAHPTFYADQPGDYVVKLTVTDGNPALQPGRLSASATVTVHAIDAPPVASAGPDVAHASRNVPVTLTGSATDPDGDARTCAWTAARPDASTRVLSAAAACNGPATVTFACDLEGTWTVSLTVADSRHSAVSSAIVTCVNDPPVASAGADQLWNLGATPPSDNPTVTLSGSFTDPNGDPASLWTWTFASVPQGSARTSADIASGTGPATGAGPLPQGAIPAATFQPDVAGRYVLRLHVEDRAGSYGEATVNVDVVKHVQALGHDVVDAAHARTANKLVLAGHDPSDATSATGMLWVYDLATGAETSVAIADATGTAGPPVAVAVTDDGTTAIYAERGVVWSVTLGATPAATRLAGMAAFTPSSDVGDVAVADLRHAMAFPATGSAPFLVYSNGSIDSSLYAGRHGSAGPLPAAPSLFVANPYGGRLDRYDILNGRQYPWSASAATSCAGRVFAAADGSCVANACGEVYGASGTGAGGLARVQTLSFLPVHLDSTAAGQVVAVEPSATAIRRFTSAGGGLASLAGAAATDPLPRWGFAGTGYTAYAPFAFLAASGDRLAVVSATVGGVVRFGVVRFP